MKDPDVFRAVKIDNDASTVVWPNGADFDPATLYEWHLYQSELQERALEWKSKNKS